MSNKTVEILEQNKTVTITEDGKTVTIDSAALSVVSVGTQGPRGPSGSATIGGKSVESGTPQNDEILMFNATSDEFEFTTEIDAGTY